ncbi:MAG: hypothetical protein ABR600_13865 [Actinomycetota bacterium]
MGLYVDVVGDRHVYAGIRDRGSGGPMTGSVRKLGVAALAAAMLGGTAAIPAGAQPAGLPAEGIVSSKNVTWVNNQVSSGGNALDFFERQESNGSLSRYAVVAHNFGFDIIDITDPAEPSTVGRYVTVGFNYHSWVSVNPTRKLVAYSIEAPGRSAWPPTDPNLGHGGSNGVDIVDISDVTNPVYRGQVAALGQGDSNGPHTIRWIDDRYLYTTLPTHIIDVADPAKPKLADAGLNNLCGHEFYPDPNIPGRTYVGFCAQPAKWGILDTTDPAHPVVIVQKQDPEISLAHEVYPSADSSFIGVTDYRIGPATGYTYFQCPGGGIHFWDISGKYMPGASLTNPIKMGKWFAPFNTIESTDPDPDSNHPNWASCTTHSWQFQAERMIFTAGVYTLGSWVGDPTAATKSSGGLYTEWNRNPKRDWTCRPEVTPPCSAVRGLGPTTWGNTTGNFLAEGDFVNASQWWPFDASAADPDTGRYVFTNGLVRGFDILKYTGPLPKKLARLAVDPAAPGGVATGKLDRYAVLTYQGWVNKSLAGRSVEVTGGGVTVMATTADDGTFSANLGLSAGSHQVTVTWTGDDTFQQASVTQSVQT